MDQRYSNLLAECLAMEQSLPDLTTWVCRDWNSNIQPSTCEVNALSDCATEVVSASYETLYITSRVPSVLVKNNVKCVTLYAGLGFSSFLLYKCDPIGNSFSL